MGSGEPEIGCKVTREDVDKDTKGWKNAFMF